MATRDTGTNSNTWLTWVAGLLVTIIMGLSGFSSTQVLKSIDKAEEEKNKLKAEQAAINTAITLKLDNISQQLSDSKSDNKIIQYTLSEYKTQIIDLQNRVKELEIEQGKHR